jgi:hypothetical protein
LSASDEENIFKKEEKYRTDEKVKQNQVSLKAVVR